MNYYLINKRINEIQYLVECLLTLRYVSYFSESQLNDLTEAMTYIERWYNDEDFCFYKAWKVLKNLDKVTLTNLKGDIEDKIERENEEAREERKAFESEYWALIKI